MIDLRTEVDKIKEISADFDKLNAESKNRYTAQIDTFELIKESFENTHQKMMVLEKNTKDRIATTINEMNEIKTKGEAVSLSLNTELTNLKKRVAEIDTNITDLAGLFYNTALLRIPVQTCHLFRMKPATHSG